MCKKILILFLFICLSANTGAEFMDSGYLSLDGGLLGVSSSDLEKDGNVYSGTLGVTGAIAAGYQLENGVEVELGYRYGPYRQHDNSDGSQNWEFWQETLFVSLGYNLPVTRRLSVGVRFATGPMWITGRNMSTVAGETPKENFTAADVAYLPEFKIESYIAGRVGLGLGIGWLISPATHVRNDDKKPIWHANGRLVSFDNGGIHARVFLKWYFEEVL